MKKISIITINYNQTFFTQECVQSVLNSKYKSFDLLLIDNGSTEENYSILRQWVEKLEDERVKLLRINSNTGYVGGVNFGLKNASESDYIMIMNNDTILDKDAVGELLEECINQQNRAIVSGIVYWYDKPKLIQNTGKIFNKRSQNPPPIGLNTYDEGQFKNVEERDMLDDIFWLFPIDLFQEIGYYSTDYWFNFEQADFAKRAQAHGYSLIFTPKAKIWHKSGLTIGGRSKNPIKSFFAVQGLLIYTFKFSPKTILYKTIIRQFFRFIKFLLLSLLDRNNFKYSISIFCGILSFIKWTIKKEKNKGEIPFILNK